MGSIRITYAMPVFRCPEKQVTASFIINPLNVLVEVQIFRQYPAETREGYADIVVKKTWNLTFRLFYLRIGNRYAISPIYGFLFALQNPASFDEPFIAIGDDL